MLNWHTPGPLNLASGQLQVWRIALDVPPDVLSTFWVELSEAEQQRAGRFHTSQLRNRYITAHGALRRILAQYVHQPAAELQFSFSAYGKPSLISKSGLTFNLSHANAWALCVVACQQAVGVDIEQVQALPDLENVAQRFFSPRERQTLAALAETAKPLGFYHCWTRKEAFIKALGSGLSHPLDSFDVTLHPNEEARLIEIRSHTSAHWSLVHLEPAPNYVGAVAAEGEITQLEGFTFDHTQI